MNQSKLKEKTCSWCEAPEKECGENGIGWEMRFIPPTLWTIRERYTCNVFFFNRSELGYQGCKGMGMLPRAAEYYAGSLSCAALRQTRSRAFALSNIKITMKSTVHDQNVAVHFNSSGQGNIN